MAIHPRYDTDRLYVSREGGWGLTSIEDNVYSSIRGIKDYIKKSKERLFTMIRNSTYNITINTTPKTRK